MMTMDGKERQTMGATHSLLYRELLVTQNKLAEQVEWVKHALGEDRKAVAAALARAEAAEAEAKAAADRIMVLDVAFSNSHKLNEHLGDENRALAARVAELEVELAAQSAQGWRDFTERPPIGEQIQIATVIDAVREEPDGLYRIGNTSEWQAWRPAPQETE